jgi:hypothetical protein
MSDNYHPQGCIRCPICPRDEPLDDCKRCGAWGWVRNDVPPPCSKCQGSGYQGPIQCDGCSGICWLEEDFEK